MIPLFSIRLDIACDRGGITEWGERVERWLGIELKAGDDVDFGGYFLQYSPDEPSELGVRGARLARHEGPPWRLDHRRDAEVFGEVELRTTDLTIPGRLWWRAKSALGDGASLAKYVVVEVAGESGKTLLPRAHVVAIDANGETISPLPELDCQLAFALPAGDLDTAASISHELLGGERVSGESQDLGGAFEEIRGGWIDGFVRPNRLSSALLADSHVPSTRFVLEVGCSTSNLMRLGEIAERLERNGVEVLAYRVGGDFVRDGVLRYSSHEFDVEER